MGLAGGARPNVLLERKSAMGRTGAWSADMLCRVLVKQGLFTESVSSTQREIVLQNG